MADLASLLLDTAATAASHALSRVQQPQQLPGTVTSLGSGTTVNVRLDGATDPKPVYDPVGVAILNRVVVYLPPSGEARIMQVIT